MYFIIPIDPARPPKALPDVVAEAVQAPGGQIYIYIYIYIYTYICGRRGAERGKEGQRGESEDPAATTSGLCHIVT